MGVSLRVFYTLNHHIYGVDLVQPSHVVYTLPYQNPIPTSLFSQHSAYPHRPPSILQFLLFISSSSTNSTCPTYINTCPQSILPQAILARPLDPPASLRLVSHLHQSYQLRAVVFAEVSCLAPELVDGYVRRQQTRAWKRGAGQTVGKSYASGVVFSGMDGWSKEEVGERITPESWQWELRLELMFG